MKKAKRPGPASLFRGKIRKPVTLTLTPAHHAKVSKNRMRLNLTRADFIGLLVEKHADTVSAVYFDAYKKLRTAVEALGGTLEHKKAGEPKGGTWVLELGGRRLRIPSEQSKRYPALDACYQLKEGVAVSQTWDDHLDVIAPAGVGQLFGRLANSSD